MSGGKPAQASEVKQTQLPAWVEAGGKENYELAKQISGQPLQQYGGQTVAGTSGMTQSAWDKLVASIGGEDPLYNEATAALRNATGELDINKFLNPYRGEVEANAIRNANESLDRNLLGVTDSARAARAFGGSRHGIESAVTRAEGTKKIGDLSAQLRSAGFDTATQTALADRGKWLPAATGLLSAAGQKQSSRLADVTALLGAGGQEQAQRQKVLDAERAKFEEARNYPVEQLNLRLAALGMSPYGKTEIGNKTSTAEQLPTDWATLLLGGAKAAPGLMGIFSDREAKTDIKKIGKDPLAGIPIYAYRYKGDPKTYPKVIGPMAQDIEKKYPSAVKKVGKHRVVDINNLMEVLS